MNFFEQELRRVAGACQGVINPTFAGRACYGDLGGDNRVKLEFVTQGVYERYVALKATVINRLDGEVDTLLFRFKDTWGKKFNIGVGIPYIWTDSGKSEWYAYYPTDADIKQLAAELGAYLNVFIDRSVISEKTRGKESVMKTIRDAQQNPPPRKNASAHKKTDSDR
jgi:hypothetical protein